MPDVRIVVNITVSLEAASIADGINIVSDRLTAPRTDRGAPSTEPAALVIEDITGKERRHPR